ncbi:uncharacterized protein V6R79_003541 [Siganus canaliculatus]
MATANGFDDGASLDTEATDAPISFFDLNSASYTSKTDWLTAGSTAQPDWLAAGSTSEPDRLTAGSTAQTDWLAAGSTTNPLWFTAGSTAQPDRLAARSTSEPDQLAAGSISKPDWLAAGSTGKPDQPSAKSTEDILENHLKCSICFSLLNDPVSTACGHSFCKECWDMHFTSSGSVPKCPLCQERQSIRDLNVNFVLRNVVEHTKKSNKKKRAAKYTGEPGQVACDFCTERKLKAVKSCLICLASFCSTHLENHTSTKRLSGHKLVDPVENLDKRACLKHGRPLELYSRKKERCACVSCMDDGEEEVVSTEEEWKKKKNELKNAKIMSQQKVDERETRISEIKESQKSCQDQIDNEYWDIEAVFSSVVSIAESAQASALQPLTDRRKAVETDAEEIIDALQDEITTHNKTISELDRLSVLEDHVLFLQSYPSLQDVHTTKWIKRQLDTSLLFGTLRKTATTMLEQIQQQLEKLASMELKRVQRFRVDVRLDPATAHPRLIVSEDKKKVRDGGEKKKECDDAPGRFNLFGSILGSKSFTSGRSYWEVEVGNKTGWDLGVARGDANRKGKVSVSPGNGYWVIVKYEDEKFAVMTEPAQHLPLRQKPTMVGVFVDYEEGLVSFFDVTRSHHIYSFSECSFGGKIFPYFSPHLKEDGKNADPLVIW